MDEFFTIVGQPLFLSGLFAGSILLVLLDYLLPVDWLAYVGYICFSLFVGATLAATPVLSIILIPCVAVAMWIAHKLVFARFLTNVPRIECGQRHDANETDQPTAGESFADVS